MKPKTPENPKFFSILPMLFPGRPWGVKLVVVFHGAKTGANISDNTDFWVSLRTLEPPHIYSGIGLEYGPILQALKDQQRSETFEPITLRLNWTA